MRFRLATRPPLRPLRAWFDIPNDISLVDGDGANFSPAELALFIDEFELLDDSNLEVIKENDLVHITRKQHVSIPRKRKAATEREPSRKKQHILYNRPRGTAQSLILYATTDSSEGETTSSESSARSGSESSSSSSSSSSESVSSSDSSSSSTSSSSSAVEVQSSKLLPPVKAVLGKTTTATVGRVPPGQGKPSTHSRNARRRLKHFYEKEQKRLEQTATNVVASDSANAVPLGSKNGAVKENQIESTGDSQGRTISPSVGLGSPLEVESMVTTLRNKNKRKGFMKAMASVVPQKILFTDSAEVPSESASMLNTAVPPTAATSQTVAPRLVSPSEKQAQGLLPSNIFVTSVEVESEGWDKKKKSKRRNNYGNGIRGNEDTGYEAETGTILNYGEPEVDWELVDKNWNDMKVLSNVSSLKEGAVIGWKALAINPVTFTPETLVHLGRINEVKNDTSSIVIEPIRRPGSNEIAFGAATVIGESESEQQGESVELEIYSFSDALKTPWRLVNV